MFTISIEYWKVIDCAVSGKGIYLSDFMVHSQIILKQDMPNRCVKVATLQETPRI